MKKSILLIFSLLTIEMVALPRYAVMRGSKCVDCHYNPTGGLLRNEDGFNWAKNNLRLIKSKNDVSHNLNNNIIVGLDFRFQYLYSQEYRKTDFHKMTGRVYLGFDLDEDINLLTNYDLYRGTFEAYGIFNSLPFNGYLKIGSFSPNFGIRLDDHTSYTRAGDAGLLSSNNSQGLIFESGYTQTGVELGLNPFDFLSLSFSVGQDKTPFRKDPSYIGRLEFSPSNDILNFLIGSSYGSFQSFNNPFELISIFGGVGFNRISILSEFVRAVDYFNKGENSNIFMLEVSYRIQRGLDFVGRYDYSLPNTDKKDDQFSHLILGFDISPYRFIKIRPQVRLMGENPNVQNDNFVLQFHFWY